jgi:curved DNA-binding protein CbpA
MSLKIEQGLFNLDFTDYHAILGVPVEAEVKDIRKRYLGIARRLHPDSGILEGDDDRQRAAEYLSKLVNPAYEKLSQEKNHAEYTVLLRLKGQQALKQQDTVVLTSDSARRVASASDIDNAYRAALRELTERQYEHLDKTLEITGQISELNLVYLMRKERGGEGVQVRRPASTATASGAARPTGSAKAAAKPTPTPASREALVMAYLRRSEGFENKQDYPRAILELRDALKMEPTNSVCHSRLGVIYLKTNQATMAKIHFNKALELNPQDEVALEGKRRLEGPNATAPDPKGSKTASGKATSGRPTPGRPTPGRPDAKGNSDSKGGGLFGLFGKKK